MNTSKLFNRNFTLMVIGQIISLFGNSIIRFALSLYVLDLTGSAAIFGGILAVSMIPTVLLSPFGGILADRIPRQRIMWGLDFTTAGLIALFAIYTGFGASLTVIAVVMILLSIIQAFYQPSVVSSIPTLASEENLMAANGIVVQVQALAGLLGPILGGVLYGILVPVHGLPPILAASCICFFLSAIMELFLRIPFTPQESKSSGLQQVKEDLGSAFHFLIHENRGIAHLLLIIAALNCFLSALFIVGLPYIVKIHLGLSAQMYGIAEAAMGCGSIIGGIASAVVSKKIGLKKSHIFMVLCSVSMLPIVLTLLLNVPVMASYIVIVLSVLFGMTASALFSIAAQTFLQKMTPVTLLGKVASFVTVFCVCAIPIGQAMYGFLFQAFKAIPWAVVLFGSLVSILIGFAAKKALAKIEEKDVVTASP